MVRLNCESSADIVSRVGAGQLGNSDRKMAFFSPKRPENLRPVFSSPKRPEQIFGPFSFLVNTYLVLLPEIKADGA